MRRFCAALTLALLAAPAQAQTPQPPRVEVSSIEGGSAGADRALRELRAYLERNAVRFLAPGQSLAVLLTDDRAGHESRTPGSFGVRVISDTVPARIELRFVLKDSANAEIAAGSRSLRSPHYFTGDRGGDPLRFEKTLLDNWLAKEFGPRR